MSESKALAIVPKSLDEVTTLAEVLAKSTLMPDALKGKVPDVVMQILAGQELGLAPMAAIRGIHVFQGKPSIAADTMVGLVLGSGICEYFIRIEETATSVTYETKRKGSPHPQRFTWSDEDTKRAGLNTKENHRLHPRAMRAARAKAALARDAYPDVLAGCYDPDEIAVPERLMPEQREPDAIDAEIVHDSTALDEALAAIANAPSEAALKSDAVKAITALKLVGSDKEQANAAYKARLEALRTEQAA